MPRLKEFTCRDCGEDTEIDIDKYAENIPDKDLAKDESEMAIINYIEDNEDCPYCDGELELL